MKKNRMIEFIKKRKKRDYCVLAAIVITTAVCTPSIMSAVKEHKGKSETPTELTVEQQSSLIELETAVVAKGGKPSELIPALSGKNYSGLNTENKQKAAELAVLAVSNTALYYNQLSTVFSGEYDYNRKDSQNPIDGQKQSPLIKGFLEDANQQYLKAYPINEATIVFMPDFDRLYKLYGNDATEELQVLLKGGAQSQAIELFRDNTLINPYKAATAQKLIVDYTRELATKNANSKFLPQLSSLGRFYHDLALAGITTNSVKKVENNQYKLDERYVDDLKTLAKGSLPLAAQARELLQEQKDGLISAEYLTQKAQESLEHYGSSVYWQSERDLSAIINSGFKKNDDTVTEEKANGQKEE